MSDGANLGIDAGRALGTILGDEPQPTDEERATADEVRARVAAAPEPCEGPPIWQLSGDGYALSADAIAKAFLLAELAEPGILERQSFYPDDFEYEGLRGKPLDANHAVWEYVMNRWPDFDDWVGGASGFQVGFAYNTARYIAGQPPAPNPAIIDLP